METLTNIRTRKEEATEERIMLEVIISAVNTGRVQRRTVATREQADRYIARFMEGGFRTRNPRDYRIEVHTRPAPSAAQPSSTTIPLGARAVSPEAAA
jgi:hypothetical protein